MNHALRQGCLNAHSAARRPATIRSAICDEKLDLLLLTETWHECSDSVVLKNIITPSGHRYLDAPRPLPPDTNFQTLHVQNYGGLALIHRSGITVTQRQLGISPTTFEYLCGFVKTSQKNFLLLGVYTDLEATAFFDESSTVLDEVFVLQCPVILCGDFNIHVDDSDDSTTVQFSELLKS